MSENNITTLIAVPMYNCGSFTVEQLEIMSKLNLPFNSDILVIDNRSSDNSLELVSEAIDKINLKIKLIQNSQNYSLGGSSKIAFKYGFKHNYDYLLIHHGSGKADINNFIKAQEHWGNFDMLLGSRFMREAKNENYSKLQYFGNIVFNFIFSILLKQKIQDLGSSTNFYRLNSEHEEFILRCADGLTFNYYLLIHQINKGLTFKYFPSPLKVTGQKSSLNLFNHLKEMLYIIFDFLYGKKILRKDYSNFKKYEFNTIKTNY